MEGVWQAEQTEGWIFQQNWKDRCICTGTLNLPESLLSSILFTSTTINDYEIVIFCWMNEIIQHYAILFKLCVDLVLIKTTEFYKTA